MLRVTCAAIIIAILASHARAESPAAISANDNTVVPGQRVGAITLYSSLSVLRALYGANNVRPKMQPLPSGDTTPGARLFEGTNRQLDLLWDEDGREKRVVEVRITGKAWTLQNGLKTGLTVAEVEHINGKSFKINASDTEYASFDGGSLATGLGIRFFPTTTTAKHSPGGGKKQPAADTESPASAPVVTQIAIWLR